MPGLSVSFTSGRTFPVLGRLADLPAWVILTIIMTFAIVVRVLATLVLELPIETGDGLGYFTMAKTLSEQGVMTDNFGQHAFFSAGYPLLLTPFFTLLGSSLGVALTVNMMLTAVSMGLLFVLGRALSGRDGPGLLAAFAYGVWLPAIWNATLVAKENLSTPLLLAVTLCAVQVARGCRPKSYALAGGIAWGAALITGGSALPLCAGVAVAIVFCWRQSAAHRNGALLAGVLFVTAAGATLSPWLYATDRMVGSPILTTNAAFNLYLGNNPAATGRFVSILDTPLGKGWEETRVELGEVANAKRLEREAVKWISENPAQAARRAALKLAYFWQPNLPDSADFAETRAVATVRLLEVAQYLLILFLGAWAFAGRAVSRGDKWILATMILGFWLLHAGAYIILRYRDPAIPLLILVGCLQITDWVRRRPAPLGLTRGQ